MTSYGETEITHGWTGRSFYKLVRPGRVGKHGKAPTPRSLDAWPQLALVWSQWAVLVWPWYTSPITNPKTSSVFVNREHASSMLVVSTSDTVLSFSAVPHDFWHRHDNSWSTQRIILPITIVEAKCEVVTVENIDQVSKRDGSLFRCLSDRRGDSGPSGISWMIDSDTVLGK